MCICHPKIVETGLDLLDFPTILFHETGYSLHTLRQASRRSWRIGQHRPVEVRFFAYKGTMQEVCLCLMGKLLVALAMEGKFASEGPQAIDGDDDMLTAMAREASAKQGYWGIRRLSLQEPGLRPANSQPMEEEPVDSPTDRDLALTDAPSLTFGNLSNSALVEAVTSQSRSSRRAAASGQLSLF